nr:PQQ-binding-like beta-propeller repeat protein [Candidatus Sigynarchaeota archaeon]
MKNGGAFGAWSMDGNGLPAFEYDCKEFEEQAAKYFTTWGNDNTHYHVLGNGCWFGIATNHGQVYLLDPRRGFTLVGGDPGITLPARSSLVTFTIADGRVFVGSEDSGIYCLNATNGTRL